jgi:hypothetical protein
LNETTAPATTSVVATVVVVPRHANGTKLNTLTVANSGSMLKHDVCLREKTTGTTCPTGAAPVVGVLTAVNTARFFNQVYSVATGSDKTAFDTVQFSTTWTVNGDCNSAKTMPNCQVYYKSFGDAKATATVSNL